MDLKSHLERLGTLLDIERAAERERLSEAHARLSLRERCARGLAISDLEVVEESGLAGRTLLGFAPALRGGSGGELGGREINTGALVRVAQRRETPDDAPTGVVARRQRGRISVLFDEPPPDWATEGRVVLELQPSAATHERLRGAVQAMGEAKRWAAPLSGEAPRFDSKSRSDRPVPRDPAPASDVPLNPEQAEALARALSAQDYFLVHGPPGTGKTTVLVEVIRRAALRGESILACAPSNLAVDNLLERLDAAGLTCVRVGHPARVLPSVLEHTLEARTERHPQARIAAGLAAEAFRLFADARKRKQRRGPGRFAEAREAQREGRRLLAEARELEERAGRDVLDRAQVVLATLTGLGARVLSGRAFDLAVVDEATQAVEPAVYLALLRAQRAVLAGDPQQLPPTILSPAAAGLSVSLFERLAAVQPGAKVTLAEQHRMNEQITGYPSAALYEGKLRAHPSVAGHSIDDRPLEVIDTAGCGFEERTPEESESKLNEGEAALAAGQARALLARGLSPETIAVISPYDAQVQRIRALLADVPELEVDTVDGFQGREKDAVVVSLVRSNDEGELGFLEDIRRVNVALTRARRKLVVIGDGATIARHPFYDGFLRYAQALGAWRSAWELAEPS